MGRGSPMRHPPKFVQAFIDRNGKPRFYLRRSGFKSVPLPGLPWSPQFMEVYEAALSGQPSQIGASRTKPAQYQRRSLVIITIKPFWRSHLVARFSQIEG